MVEPDLSGELDALTAELVEVQDQLLALYDLARSLRGYLEPEPLLDALLASAVRLARAGGGFATLAGDSGRPPVMVATPGVDAELGATMAASGGMGARQMPMPAGRLLVVPIPLHEQATAVLGLFRLSGALFSAPEEKLVSAMAAQAGAQLEGVLLHQESLRRTRLNLEFELARRVQAGLTPEVPLGTPGLDVTAESRPASIVGGDFYDFTPTGHGMVTLVGDVAGKGIPAAMLVGMTRAVIRASTRSAPRAGPAAVLRRANEDLYYDYSQLGQFATVLLASYDPIGRRLLVANAGHSPVIYRSARGRARLIRSSAPPLGVLPDWDGEDVELWLDRDDLLIAATDGFSDATNPTGTLFGHERLLDLANEAEGSAAAVARAFFRASDAFEAGSETGPVDDRTIVVLRGLGG